MESETNNSKQEINAKTKTAFKWIASTSIIRQVIVWGLTLVTARVLTPADYGVAALPGTLLPYLTLIATMKLDSWIIQEHNLSDHKRGSIFSLILLLSLGASVFCYLIAPSVANFYGDSELSLMFKVYSVVFILQGLQTLPESILRKSLSFGQLSIVDMIIPIIQGVLTLVLAIFGFGYWSLVVGVLFRYIARCIALFCLRNISFRLAWDWQINKRAIKFGLHAAAATAMWILYSTTDDVVIGRLFTKEELGFYTMAYWLSQLPISKLQMVIGQVLVPYYSQLKNSGHDTIEPFLKVTRMIVGLIAPILIGLAIISEEAIHLVLTEQWLPMAAPLKLLCIVAVLQSFVSSMSALFSAIGKPQAEFKSSIIGAIVLPASFAYCAITFGMNGIFIAWLIGYPIFLFFSVVILRDTVGIPVTNFFMNLRGPIVTVVLMAVTTIFVRDLLLDLVSQFPLLIITISCGVLSYITFYILLFREEALELLTFREFLSKRKFSVKKV